MPMRLTGLTSGLDTESMVRELIKAEKMPVDKLLQKKQTIQWKMDDYKSMNLKLSSFRDSLSTARFSGDWSKSSSGVPLTDDEIVAKVKEMASKYNDMVSSLNTELDEEKYRDYQPLTSDQKAAMSESDISNWEAKAKSGSLRNDDVLGRAVKDLRGLTSTKLIGSDVNTSFDTLTEIGITTPAYMKGSADNGKLIVNETKLRAALATNRDDVIAMFSRQDAGAESGKGIFQRAYEIADKAITSITRKLYGGLTTAESLSQQIGKIDSKVTDMNERISKREDYYYRMFSNMEKAIANSNAQISWLQSQLG
ncbi:flagellar hook-associated 2 domain protein [Paenibacillus curdlanolyticus YK9]|uniref:Filament cap protein n=1 Tax=Paenibacillus curdlanolyticus YK9 TaxID=717606 RepID=E0IEC6_9BACL|nr:flagellar filament capping protein FliD [Paenibacillus curdlanolyticus]EFM09014.1 flagellar hook-associated 2 domain protein [Paenibacillus curdlanolyticus YK9]